MNTQEVEAEIEAVKEQYDVAIKLIREQEDRTHYLQGRFDLLMKLKIKGEEDAASQVNAPTTKTSRKRTGK